MQHVFGHAAGSGGPPLQLADEHTLALVTGHALLFTSTVSYSQHLLVRPRPRQLTAFDCNWRTRVIAVAAREPRADIVLYSFPDKKPRGRLSSLSTAGGAPAFEYSHVKFSRCGRRLVSLSPALTPEDNASGSSSARLGNALASPSKSKAATASNEDASPPDAAVVVDPELPKPRQTLCIWDTDQLAPLAGCERGVVDIDATFVSFDPSNADQLVIGGDDGLQIWKVYPLERGASILRALPVKPLATSPLPSTADSEELEEKRVQFVCHAWKPQGRVLVANRAGELILVDAGAAAVEKQLPLAMRADRCVIAGVVATAETIVMLYADGAIVWLSDSGDELLQTAALPGVGGRVGVPSAPGLLPMAAVDDTNNSHEASQMASFVTAVAPAPSYSKAFVETRDGQIFEVKTSVQQDDEDEDGGVGDAMQSSPTALGDSLLVTPWSKAPTGAVCATAALTPFGGTLVGGDALLATGGVSGDLALWSLVTCRLVAMTDVAALFSTSLLDKDANAGASTGSSAGNSGAMAPIVITALAARAADPILVIGDSAGRLRALCVAKVIGGGNSNNDSLSSIVDTGSSGAVELLPLHSVQLAGASAPIDTLELHPTQPVLLAASTRDRVVFLLSMDHEKRFQVLAFLELESADEHVVDVRWSVPAHTPNALTVTCFSSKGLFLVARYQPNGSAAGASTGSGTPVQLRGKIVAFEEDVLTQCASLRLLSSAPMSMMLATAPEHGDLVLMKYPEVVLDPTEKISILSKVIAKDAHDGGISAFALFPRVMPNGAELVATAGTDGVLTLWFLSFGGAANSSNAGSATATTAGPGREWQLEDVLAAKKRSIVAHAGPVTSLQFLSVGDQDNGDTLLVSTGADGHVFVLDVRLHFGSLASSGSEAAVASASTWTPSQGDGSSGEADSSSQQHMSPLYMNMAAFAKYESVFRPEVELERAPLLELMREGEAQKARERSDPRKDDTRARLRELSSKLKLLLAENDKLPEDERLVRDEFVLNVEWREQLLRKHRTRADKVREGVERDLARMAVVRSRMKTEFWDSHEEHGVQLDGLFPGQAQQGGGGSSKPPPAVFNFPMRKLSRKEQLRGKQIELLRLVGLVHHRQEAKDRPSASGGHRGSMGYADRFEQTLPPTIDWMLDAGRHHPSLWNESAAQQQQPLPTDSSAVATTPGGGTTTTAMIPQLSADYNAVNRLQLVYHPAAARSSRQQRAQIWLLKACVRELAAGFNAEFAAASRLKAAKMDEVEAKNARMHEILSELAYIASITPSSAVATATAAAVNDQGSAPPPKPLWAPHEVAASILEVSPEEMTQTPYETEAARQQRAKEREEARALEAQRARDDAAGRALRDMMDDTLEVKKDHPFAAVSAAILAAGASAKEPWMLELAPEDMTPDQRQQVAQLEAAQAKLREEQDKYRKGLDLELKKLRADVADIARAFDDKLRALHARYLATRRRALAQQLYELRLGEHLMVRERLEGEAREAEREARERAAEVETAQKDADVFAARLERSKDEWHRASDEDRALERGFARDLEELVASSSSSATTSSANATVAPPAIDHELMKHLLELFRKRKPDDLAPGGGASGSTGTSTKGIGARGKSSQHLTAKQRLLAANEGGAGLSGMASSRALAASNAPQQSTFARGGSLRDEDESLPSLDPFQSVAADEGASSSSSLVAASASSASIVTPLDYEADRPEGVLLEDRVWRALNALRSRKILAERSVRDKVDALARARATGDELRHRLALRQSELLAAHSRLGQLRERLARLASNAPLLVLVKQGQDESASGALADGGSGSDALLDSDEDALLVTRARVEALNDVIRLHGQEQVGVLGKIKDFRKSINVMEWEHALLALQARDTDEKYTDLQLLRVTRELQELFQHGGDSARRHAREAALLEAKLAHLGQHRARAAGKRGEKRAALAQQLRECQRENRAFREQMRALETHVQIREEICASRRRHQRRPGAGDDEDNGGGGDAGLAGASSAHGARLKAIAVRRKLVDLARAQTDEIEFLRLELDKMRRRTFPSFAQQQARDTVD